MACTPPLPQSEKYASYARCGARAANHSCIQRTNDGFSLPASPVGTTPHSPTENGFPCARAKSYSHVSPSGAAAVSSNAAFEGLHG